MIFFQPNFFTPSGPSKHSNLRRWTWSHLWLHQRGAVGVDFRGRCGAISLCLSGCEGSDWYQEPQGIGRVFGGPGGWGSEMDWSREVMCLWNLHLGSKERTPLYTTHKHVCICRYIKYIYIYTHIYVDYIYMYVCSAYGPGYSPMFLSIVDLTGMAIMWSKCCEQDAERSLAKSFAERRLQEVQKSLVEATWCYHPEEIMFLTSSTT